MTYDGGACSGSPAVFRVLASYYCLLPKSRAHSRYGMESR